MQYRNFWDLTHSRWERGKFLCVGLDVDSKRLPKPVQLIAGRHYSVREPFVRFAGAIVDAVHDVVGAFKMNSAFYEAHGAEGISALRDIVRYIHLLYPDIPVIVDAKRGDVAHTNEKYAQFAFEFLGADAITVHPYMGQESLVPFLAQGDKGIFVLCRTSNSGPSEFQSLMVDGVPLYVRVAEQVADEWNTHGNCGLVVGATVPSDIVRVRQSAPDIPLLIPGVGAQGGVVDAVVSASKDTEGHGFLINSSRSVLYASQQDDFAEQARQRALEIHNAIRAARSE